MKNKINKTIKTIPMNEQTTIIAICPFVNFVFLFVSVINVFNVSYVVNVSVVVNVSIGVGVSIGFNVVFLHENIGYL